MGYRGPGSGVGEGYFVFEEFATKTVYTGEASVFVRYGRDWANDVRGHGIDAGHHVAEEAPGPLSAALGDFFTR